MDKKPETGGLAALLHRNDYQTPSMESDNSPALLTALHTWGSFDGQNPPLHKQ